MRKRLTRFIILTLLILAGIYLVQHRGALPSFTSIFKSRSVQIENSAILVKEINGLSQLITITAYNEIAIDSSKKGWSLFNNPLVPALLNLPDIKGANQHLVLVGRGKILAGVNLAKLATTDVFVKDDSVSVNLPRAEILQVILNPSDFEVFEERGDWTDDEVKAVKLKLRERLVANFLQQGILQQSSARAIKMMESFLGAFGFKKINVHING